VPAPADGGTAFYLACTFLGLVMLGMAGHEWRRLRADDYARLSLAAGTFALTSVVALVLAQFLDEGQALCMSLIVEAVALALFAWGFMLRGFAARRRASILIGIGLAVPVSLLALCLVLGPEAELPLPVITLGLAGLLLPNLLALVLWIRYRRHTSLWLGAAFALPAAGLVAGLAGIEQAPLWAFLGSLPLFTIEVYRTVLADLGAYGHELQTVSERALQQTQDMAFLLEVGQAVTASLDLSVVLERVSEAVARAVDADWAYVLLPADDESDVLTVAARYGWWGRRWEQEAQLPRQISIRLENYSLVRHAIQRQRQVLANRPEEYGQFEPLHKSLGRPQSGPTLVQPIYVQERPLGAVLLGRVGAQRDFDESEGRLCQALVAQVATAIDNARLYHSLDKQARRLASLLRVREEEVAQRQAILESIADGVVVVSDSEEVVMANAVAERILGVRRDRLAGRTIRRLYAELLRSGRRRQGDRALFTWGDKDVTGSMAPVRMPDGSVLGYVAVFRDVTRERQAELAKVVFIETVSHELRTPLTSIKGYVELLAAGAVGNVTPQQRHFLEIANRNTERMVSLVNNLIAVSEMEQGTIKVEPRPVDMAHLVAEAVEAVEQQAAAAGLSLTVDLPRDLAPAWGDPQQLRQVVDNLLDNALRYTPAGGRVAVWAAEAHLEDDGASPSSYLVVSVRDTGVGIPTAEQERIFERFYRSDNPLSIEAGGTGMGLAIVKSLVEAHGGRVWVDSKPGQGSTFSFTVPTSEGVS
jgi:PAS domain S-box-containing protein